MLLFSSFELFVFFLYHERHEYLWVNAGTLQDCIIISIEEICVGFRLETKAYHHVWQLGS